MIRNILLIIAIVLGNFYFSHAQQSDNKSREADKYIDVIKVYEMVVEEGYESAQIYEKLAQSQFSKRNYIEAKKWFEKLIEIEKNPKPVIYLQYAHTLEALEETKKANQYLALFEEKSKK